MYSLQHLQDILSPATKKKKVPQIQSCYLTPSIHGLCCLICTLPFFESCARQRKAKLKCCLQPEFPCQKFWHFRDTFRVSSDPPICFHVHLIPFHLLFIFHSLFQYSPEGMPTLFSQSCSMRYKWDGSHPQIQGWDGIQVLLPKSLVQAEQVNQIGLISWFIHFLLLV